ncbi:hypothetical protein Tco_1457695, partial [Tanacetum coccineum]
GGAGDNTSEGGNSGSAGEGIWGSGEDHRESSDDEGSSNGGDEVGTNMGKGGGIPNDGASGLLGESIKGGGNGR